MAEDKKERYYLVDGSGFIFRAFHALPPMSRADGTPVNAVYGFTQMLMKLLADYQAGHLAVIFDTARKNFRNEIYPDYKGHRPEPPEDLVPQFPLFREAVAAFDLPCLEMEGFEADDLIATYARQAREKGAEVVVVSSDKDLMQLVGDGVEMLDPIKNTPIGPDAVMAKFGVAPGKVPEVQALAGDPTDNVPGVPGIGVKTAAQLIQDYGDLESLLARAGEIKQPKRREKLIEHAEDARVSLKLVTLDAHVDVTTPLEQLARTPLDKDKVKAFLEEQQFKAILSRLETWWSDSGNGDAGGAPTDAPPAAPKVETVSYELVTDLDHLDRWIDACRAAGVCAVDTETTALNSHKARLVGVSLAVEPGRACYIPLRHVAPGPAQSSLDLGATPAERGEPTQIPLPAAVARLQALLDDDAVLKVGHNIKYDLTVLASEGLRCRPVDDTMVLSYVLDGTSHGHGMDELAELWLGHACTSYKDVCGTGKSQVPFAEVALETARDYAAEDADITLRLFGLFRQRLLAEKMMAVHEDLDRPLVPILARMEHHGIKVDAGVLKGLSADFAKGMAGLEIEIHQLAGEEFNIGSPKQLGEILFDRMSLPGGKKGKTGAYATPASVLEELAAQGHDLPAKVLEWRQLSKLKSTYADALVEQISARDGRVHTSFSQTVTTTGRLSSNEPNLQNIPIRSEAGRKIRAAFVAEPGHKLIAADYSQIELRIVAHVAGIEALKQAFRDGIDIHAATASQVFGVPVEGMDPTVRRQAKAINFGIIYGISAFGLAAQLGIDRGEAKRFIDNYFKRFPDIRDYMEETRTLAREQGFVTTLFGRKVFTPGIADKNPARRGFAERQAINAPIQGAAADIIKRAMIRLPDALADAGLDARMLLQVHDELVFEAPTDQAEATAKLVAEVMEGAASLSVPLDVDTGIAESWDKAH